MVQNLILKPVFAKFDGFIDIVFRCLDFEMCVHDNDIILYTSIKNNVIER